MASSVVLDFGGGGSDWGPVCQECHLDYLTEFAGWGRQFHWWPAAASGYQKLKTSRQFHLVWQRGLQEAQQWRNSTRGRKRRAEETPLQSGCPPVEHRCTRT